MPLVTTTSNEASGPFLIDIDPKKSVLRELRTFFASALVPLARVWIRYWPFALGKAWLWRTFHWRHRKFTSRMRFGGVVTGSTQDLIQRHLYYFGTWEPHISNWVRATLHAGDGFVDIGANIGYYSLLASGVVGASGAVVAVEASPTIHALLAKHVRLNRRANIRTVHCAAAASAGMVKLYHGQPDNIGKTTTVGRDGEFVEVTAQPLFEILVENEILRARIIKIDVEGAELQVLRGLVPLFERMRSDLEVVMEVSPNLMPGSNGAGEEIFSIMRAHGFAAFAFDNDYRVESYLRKSTHARPRPMAGLQKDIQMDVLFSRAAA
jgi:FkbM family methyltransferase